MFPLGAVPVAESVTGVLTTTLSSGVGLTMLTVGGVPMMVPPPEPPEVTLTVTAGELPVKPRASVAIAVSMLGRGSPVTGSMFCFAVKVTV